MVRRIAPALAGAFVVALLVAFLFNGVTTAQETPLSPDLAPEGDAAPTFTYQGYLQQGGAPVNGTCDFQFRLYSALTGGTQIGSTLSFNREAVSQGRFTIEFNFGANPINGQGRWLQMAVRCPAGAGSFTTLTPRQVLTGTPFALSLLPGAGTTGTVASSGILNLSNSSTASGALGLNVALAPIGVQVGRASNNGLQVNSAGNNGLKVASASNNGVQVDAAGENGLQVDSAGGNGVQVSSASGNGLLVDAAGAPSISYFSSLNDGVEVAGAQGHGFYLGRADQDGLRIRSTGDDAIQIGEGGVAPNYGVYAPAPGTPFITLLPNTANANGEWALYTTDWIYSATIGASANALVAVAAGDLAAGDVAAAAGLAGPLPDSLAPLVQVQAADGAAGIVGVIASRMELQPAPGKDGLMVLHSVPGPAKVGDYVLITTTGAVQVAVQDDSVIQPGQRVTVGGSGAVRGLETRTVEGMTVSEGAPTVGVALQAPQDGLVWVFVAPE